MYVILYDDYFCVYVCASKLMKSGIRWFFVNAPCIPSLTMTSSSRCHSASHIVFQFVWWACPFLLDNLVLTLVKSLCFCSCNHIKPPTLFVGENPDVLPVKPAKMYSWNPDWIDKSTLNLQVWAFKSSLNEIYSRKTRRNNETNIYLKGFFFYLCFSNTKCTFGTVYVYLTFLEVRSYHGNGFQKECFACCEFS